MKISDLITKLETQKAIHGDVEVCYRLGDSSVGIPVESPKFDVVTAYARDVGQPVFQIVLGHRVDEDDQ